MSSTTINHYDRNAEHYSSCYNSVAAEEVHAAWIDLLLALPPARALDVGAGTGRDALWLTKLGWQVTAVEPANSLRELGEMDTQGRVSWLSSALPYLAEVDVEPNSYRLILLSAVWMHLPEGEREVAFGRLVELLAEDGKLVITLRFGPSDPERPMYPVSVDELRELALYHAMQLQELVANSEDKLQRQEVSWTVVVISKEAKR